MTPILAMRAALREVLAPIGVNVFDEARDAAMPYASFGDCTVRIWTDGNTNFAEHRLALHIWSRAPGDAEALDLAGRIAGKIEAAMPDTEALVPVHWSVSGHEIRRPTREGVRQATLRITALTEHQRGETP